MEWGSTAWSQAGGGGGGGVGEWRLWLGLKEMGVKPA